MRSTSSRSSTPCPERCWRWRRCRGGAIRDLGWIQPGAFIPIAEESGLIVSLGQHVVREALGQIGERGVAKATSALPLGVFVNVSPRELSEPDYISFLMDTLTELRARPGRSGAWR